MEKAVDFCFADACVKYRQIPIPGVDDATKEDEIEKMKLMLREVKGMVARVLETNGIVVVV